jgi:hypothetical protein
MVRHTLWTLAVNTLLLRVLRDVLGMTATNPARVSDKCPQPRFTRACIQLGGFARERNRIKHGTPFYDQEPGVILGIPKSVVE